MTAPYALKGKNIYIAGHRGMVGGALMRRLAAEDCAILTAAHGELDLTRQSAVEAWMRQNRPHAVIIAAARVGGILANDRFPAEFLYDNLMIEANLIHSALETGVEKLLFLGSSCIYPKLAPQPISESALLTGPLEPTNQWYAIAKIAGLKMCEAYRRQYGVDFISAMPTNLYGAGDNFDENSSHVLPALIRKAHSAKARGDRHMRIWGTGAPLREFLYADDCADALAHVLQHYSGDETINIGSGFEISIASLARKVMRIAGLDGDLLFDAEKPDGTPRKLMDSRKLQALGWTASTGIDDGVQKTWAWYLENKPGAAVA
jgi:GDP-L-fucose synthase